MSLKTAMFAGAVALVAVAAGQASANPSNLPPPSGAILDLDGQPITNTGQLYSVDFVAGVANTAITFAFRQDPSFEAFSNASVVDLTTASGNLLTDGDFSAGTAGSNSPPGWTYANLYGATFGGVVGTAGECGAFGTCWYDGAVQAYDAISQTIGTTVGDTYQVTFNLNGGGSVDGIYRRLSTNGDVTDTGGNGIDVLVYAQAGLPPVGTPEPATWALMLMGFGGLGAMLRRRSGRLATA
jgi:hypothetical protein